MIIIGPAHPLRGGGMSTFNERLARAFQADGHDTSIYTFSLQYPSFLFPGTTQYSKEAAPADLKIKVAINSVNPLNWIKVGRMLQKEKADLLVVRYWLPLMGPCLGTILRIAKKNKYSKVVCIADNVIPHEKRPGDKPFTKYFIGAVDSFITMSAAVLQDLKTFTKTKAAALIPHPLYDNFGEAIPMPEARDLIHVPKDIPVVLFFGFIRHYKGLDILLQVMALLRQRMPALKLLVAGEYYGDPKPYETLIETLNLQDQLILRTSFIADDEIRNYLCAADLVVQPYRDATQSGVTPLAYHFEKPMLVTNVGGLPAMVPHDKAGLVAEPEPVAIAQAIETFFAKGAAYFLPGIREEKKKYSWEKMVDGIFSVAGIR